MMRDAHSDRELIAWLIGTSILSWLFVSCGAIAMHGGM